MYAAIKYHMRRNVAVLIVLIRVRGSWSGNHLLLSILIMARN